VALTEKEKQVLTLRGKGLTQVQVAKKLKISQAAVSDFERNARQKIKEAEDAIAFAKSLGVRT
jgi:Tfx family DNA-binding protein